MAELNRNSRGPYGGGSFDIRWSQPVSDLSGGDTIEKFTVDIRENVSLELHAWVDTQDLTVQVQERVGTDLAGDAIWKDLFAAATVTKAAAAGAPVVAEVIELFKDNIRSDEIRVLAKLAGATAAGTLYIHGTAKG